MKAFIVQKFRNISLGAAMTLALVNFVSAAPMIGMVGGSGSVFGQTDYQLRTISSRVNQAVTNDKRKNVEFLSFIRTELFFGRNRSDGTEITEEEFADFLSRTITPEFPDGLTVLDGIGQFRDPDGNTIREKAKVLILLYPLSTRRQSSRKIEKIRTAYKERFDQQSVLRVDEILPARVSF